MTLLIQRAEHRDTQAIHAKLDELLSADAQARTELGSLDQEEPEDIKRKRDMASLRSLRSPPDRRSTGAHPSSATSACCAQLRAPTTIFLRHQADGLWPNRVRAGGLPMPRAFARLRPSPALARIALCGAICSGAERGASS
jgi:Low affinity iron permease